MYKIASPTGRSFRVLVMHSVLQSPGPLLWKYDLKVCLCSFARLVAYDFT